MEIHNQGSEVSRIAKNKTEVSDNNGQSVSEIASKNQLMSAVRN